MADLLAFLLADGRTPTGGHAHSGGLEAAELTAAAVPGFMRARLRTVGRVEAAAAVLAARAGTIGELLGLEAELAARTPSAAARTASRGLGLALLRTGRRLFPQAPLIGVYAREGELTPRPLALGVVGAAAGLEAVAVARLSLYDDAATVAAAAPKLLAVDAVDTASWVAGLAADVEAVAAEAATADELPAACTPLLDRRAELHHTSPRRLFVS